MVNESERYAVFIDIDGTLISGNFKVPERNIEAIAKARKMGHKIFINTGRSYGNIPDVLFEQLDVDGYIAGSGANIIIEGKQIFTAEISTETLCDVSEYFLTHTDYWCIFEGREKMYYIDNNIDRHDHTYQQLITSSDDFKVKHYGEPIEVIAAGKIVPQDFIDRFSHELTVIQFPTYADCIINTCSKAGGMQTVLDYYSIPVEHSIAIGDSANDVSMLKAAGISVAVGNAHPSILPIVDYVSLTNHEGGVGAAIEHFLLK